MILILGCSGGIPRHPDVEPLGESFSGELARAHVRALGELGPRAVGSREDLLAREYIARELRQAGLVVTGIDTPEGRHLLAERAGVGAGSLLLVAPYSAMGALEARDDSGLAVLLEVARVFALGAPPPYTLRFALCEVRPASPSTPENPSPGDPPGFVSDPVPAADSARERRVVAGRSLAAALEQRGDLANLRAVVVFDRVGAPGLRLARDLRSHPVFREIFWEAAMLLGFEETFPADGDWTSAEGIELGFRDRPRDRVVVLSDESFARPHLVDEGDRPSEISQRTLEAVGLVTVDALREIMQRLEKIDAFKPTSPDLIGNP
jgi:hypothetical protein